MALDTFSEKELSRGVDGQTEEDGLDVGGGGPAVGRDGQRLHGLLDMLLFQIQLTDLFTGKLRSQQATGAGPFFSVGGELSHVNC